MNQNGYFTPGTQGYGPTSAEYPPAHPEVQGSGQYFPGQTQQPGYAPYNGASTGQQNYLYTSPAYSPQSGYQMPSQQGTGTGSYIPQTPFSPGYTTPGYQPPSEGYPQGSGYPPVSGGYQVQPGAYQQPAGYQQPGSYPPPQSTYAAGYSPYNQMGKAAQQPQTSPVNSIPLNGGGYVPQRVPVRKRPFEIGNEILIAAGVILVALFIATVTFLKNSPAATPIRILVILLSVVSAGILWIKPLVPENRRLTYSVLALALCVLTAVSFLGGNTPNDTQNKPDVQAGTVNDSGNGTVQEIPPEGGNSLSGGSAAATPAPEMKDTQITDRLVAFFKYWNENRQDEMLALCAPSWQSKMENPRTSLFILLANRKPMDCTLESITGTDADSSRRVTLSSKIDRNNGKPAETYRMTILMVKENNEWYIDPQSLQSYETLDTPDPNVTPTVGPTDTAPVYPTTELYFNPKGGEYYHADPNCKIINEKYTPLGGHFTYAEINNDPYVNLKPCNVCGAPLRP